MSFVICVLLRRIPHLGSEIQFIDDMVDSHVHVGEQGHMFTTLKVTQYYEIVLLHCLTGSNINNSSN